MNKLAPVVLGVMAVVGASHAYAAQLIVGVSWSNFQEERWKTDEAAMKTVFDAQGVKYISADAQSSTSKQLTDVDSLISQGANAIILLAEDADAVEPAVDEAVGKGIPIIGYDRLIENPKAFYLTFDNKLVGAMQAQAVVAAAPKGNYVFIKGNAADPNSDFLFAGQMQVLKPAMDRGDIKNIGETYTDNWDPANAQTEMAQFLAKNDNKVDAVLSENDGMAGGVVAALAAQGLAGQVPVSGQDGDHAALNRIALGTQTVSVWKDSRDLGKNAAQIAIELAQGTPLDKIAGSVVFDGGPRKVPVNALFLKPIAITRDNLDVVIDAGWISRAEVCEGVQAGKVAVCG